MSTTDLVNMERALKICGANQELFKDLMVIILGTIPERIELLETFLEEENWEDLDFQTHKYKGALRNICADQAVEICQSLEVAVKKKDLPKSKALIQSLDENGKNLEVWFKGGEWKQAFLEPTNT